MEAGLLQHLVLVVRYGGERKHLIGYIEFCVYFFSLLYDYFNGCCSINRLNDRWKRLIKFGSLFIMSFSFKINEMSLFPTLYDDFVKSLCLKDSKLNEIELLSGEFWQLLARGFVLLGKECSKILRYWWITLKMILNDLFSFVHP